MKLWPESIWTVSNEQVVPAFVGGAGKYLTLRPCDTVRLAPQPLFEQYVIGELIQPLQERRNIMMSRGTFNARMRAIRDDTSRWFIKRGGLYLSANNSPPLQWSPDDTDVLFYMNRPLAILRLVEDAHLADELELWRSSGTWDETGTLEDTTVLRQNIALLNRGASFKSDIGGFSAQSNDEDATTTISIQDASSKLIYAVANDRWFAGYGAHSSGPYVFWQATEYIKWSLAAQLDRFTIHMASDGLTSETV